MSDETVNSDEPKFVRKRATRWRAAAERDGRTLAGWLRWVADKAAAKTKAKPRRCSRVK